MKPQIILINGKNPMTQTGGYQTYTYNLAKTLTELGYEVKIYCFGLKNEVITNNIGTIATVYSRLFYLPLFKSIEIAGLILLAPRLAWSIPINSPTILWGIGPWSLSAALLKIVHPKNVTYLSFYPTTFRHEFEGNIQSLQIKDYGVMLKLEALVVLFTLIPLYTLTENFFLNLADKIIVHYLSAKKILQSQFGIKNSKFIQIADYCEPIKSSLKVLPKIPKLTKPLILLISRQDGRKGINFLLHAFNILNLRGIKYSAAIIGGGKLLNSHKNLAMRLNLNNLYMSDFVANSSFFLKKANLYVFPSVEEGSSALSILEAMQYGLPIVSTNVDGIVEDLEDGKTAILVPPKDALALADAMQRLIQSPKLARKLGKAAKVAFHLKHNLTKVKKELNLLISSYNA